MLKCLNYDRRFKSTFFCQRKIDSAIIGRLVGRFGTPGVDKNIFVIQVKFHIKGSGPKYIELESPTSSTKCGILLNVGKDYILAGQIIEGIRGKIDSCCWMELWDDIPLHIKWRLFHKRMSCNTQKYSAPKMQKQQISSYKKSNTIYPNNQQMPQTSTRYNLNQVYHISPPKNALNQMFHISPQLAGGGDMDHRNRIGNQMNVAEPPEGTDYVGGSVGMMFGGYMNRNRDMYNRYRELMD
ncbi:uncharacterized protein LOC133174027 [Saccostrea echinata]|uniref:uncharacterized protein LOC133174027 n=1 Tax=Saccostrea echinata TaxID=191078 RepID=UPI002A7F439A|nr:uncharacterized protein LOC133174027 [Saccostrea echinata]